MEVLLFMFIKSLRSADFPLFVGCLKEIITWMFALDHIHYARWMTVFLEDLFLLPCSQRTTFECLSKGYFTVKKSNRVFSNMGIDQAHEQSNKLVKIDGGAIGILDNENALVKCAIAAPIITELLDTEEDEIFRSHHEDTDSFENTFRKENEALFVAFDETGNPFAETEEGLVQLATKHVLDDGATKSVREAKVLGKKQ